MFNAQRRLVLAVLIVFTVLLGATPAAAASGGRAFIGSPNGAVGIFGNIVVDPGGGVSINFGVTGVAVSTVVDAALQAPDYSGISVTTSLGGCAIEGRSARCSNAVGNDAIMWGGAYIAVAANAPLGYAGLIIATTPGGATATIPLWIVSQARGSDLDYRATDVTGGPGDTVTVKVTVVNRGPSPQPYWGLGGMSLPGARIVGQRGCSPGVLRATNWQCAHTAMTAVGESITVSFDLAIDANASGPITYGGFNSEWYLSDPNHSNDNLVFKLLAKTTSGSSNGGTSGGGTSGGGSNAGGTTVAATATADPTATPSTSSVAEVTPSPVSPQATQPSVPVVDLAAQPVSRGGGSIVLVSTSAGLVLAFAAAGLLFFRRRRASIAGSSPTAAADAVASESTDEETVDAGPA